MEASRLPNSPRSSAFFLRLSLFSLFLQRRESRHGNLQEGCQWTPECGSWMLEGIPKYPLEGLVTHLARVERSMRLRRKRLMEALAGDEIAPTVRVKKLASS